MSGGGHRGAQMLHPKAFQCNAWPRWAATGCAQPGSEARTSGSGGRRECPEAGGRPAQTSAGGGAPSRSRASLVRVWGIDTNDAAAINHIRVGAARENTETPARTPRGGPFLSAGKESGGAPGMTVRSFSAPWSSCRNCRQWPQGAAVAAMATRLRSSARRAICRRVRGEGGSAVTLDGQEYRASQVRARGESPPRTATANCSACTLWLRGTPGNSMLTPR